MFFSSLKSRIVFFVIGLVFLSVLIVTIFSSQRTKQALQNSNKRKAISLLEATRSHVESQYNSILFHKSSMFSRRKIELRNNTTIAFSIINEMYDQYQNNSLSEASAKQRAFNHLKKLRYDGDIGYFWLNNTSLPYPRMIMHPTIPGLDGLVLDDPAFNCALGKKENLFKASVEICLKQNEGFIDYLWPKPVLGGLTEQQPKISFVKLFKAWNWIIGTGVYIDDIEQDVQNRIFAVIEDLNKTILKQKIGESGYFFIFNEKNKMLVHPNLPNKDMSSVLNPETGQKLLEEFKETSLNPHRSMTYLWDKPGFEGEYRFLKEAYITSFKPLGWYIGSSVYLKEYEKEVSSIINTIVVFSVIFVLLAIVLSLIVSKNIITPLNRLVSSIKNTDKNGIPVDEIPEIGTSELRTLGTTMNSMIKEINISRDSLFSSEQRFRILSEASQEGIIITKNGKLLDCNQRFLDISGYKLEELLNKMIIDFVVPEYQQMILEKMETDFQDTYEFKAINKDGSAVPVEITTRNVEYRGNLCRLSAIKDLTRVKESESKEKEYQLQLMQADKMVSLGTLVSGVAHEINNPNNAIVFNAPILKDIFNDAWPILEEQCQKTGPITLGGLEYNQVKDSVKDLFEGIILSADQIKKIVFDLKSFARPSHLNERIPIDINEVVKASVKLLHNQIRKSSNNFSVQYLEDKISLKGNFQHLLQVVINLLSNACEALENRSQSIEIEIIADGILKELRIVIKDQGCGIPKSDYNFVMDPFFTTKRDTGGTGLGLSVSNGIMKNHRGRIDIQSIEGEGSNFTMVLPFEPDAD